MVRTGMSALIISAVVLLVMTSILAYAEGPPAAVTGGFGEGTCVKCHGSFDVNAGRASGLGDIVVSGFPRAYRPGDTYTVKLELTHVKDRGVWGFQLAARAKEGGEQAGQLKPTDGSTQIVEEKGVQYIEHTADGSFSNSFGFNWIAPATAVGDVVVNAAGNAANGDADSGGDYIYSTSVMIPPASAKE